MKNKYLSARYFAWNIVFILILALLLAILYRQGYLTNITTASQETINITYNVTSKNDITNQEGKTVMRGSSQMWVGTGSNTSKSYLGIRFTGKKLPLDAIITAAEITFTSPSNQTIPINTAIYVENNTLAPAFSTKNPPSNRLLLKVKKKRNDTVKWQKDRTYSYDVTNLVKEAYRTNGLNGSIAFIIQGTDRSKGQKIIYGTPETLKSPRLRIQYHLPDYIATKSKKIKK